MQVRGLAASEEISYGYTRKMDRDRRRTLEGQLTAVRRDHDSLRRAMYEATQLQRRLCGPRLLRRDPYEIASEIFPVRDLSGDFTCAFEHNNDVVFAIGDIAGKSLSAGMWFTYMLSVVRLQIEALWNPAAALSSINRDLLLSRLQPPLVTMFLARLNPVTGEITYCGAGHPPTLVLRRGGAIELLNEGGPLLGALPEAPFVGGLTRLHPGDTLVGYSDGVAECRNDDGTDFGAERIIDGARLFQVASASSTLFSILGAAEDFAGTQPREDDMALIIVRRAAE